MLGILTPAATLREREIRVSAALRAAETSLLRMLQDLS
jgi:hypothetical protein